MKKLNLDTQSLHQFKSDYKNIIFDTEVISNTICSFLEKEDNGTSTLSSKEKQFLNLFNFNRTPLGLFFMISLSIQKDFLRKTYGKSDFQFQGNRRYCNYLFKYNEITFILSDKSEYIIPTTQNENFSSDFFGFLMELYQELINFVVKNKDDSKYSKPYSWLVDAQKLNQLDTHFQISYN